MGKNQKSELCWKDFEHIEKERDIAFNILTLAVQTQAKGINILLYGSVGTGKTQLAKLLANKAKVDMYSVSAEFMDKEASRKDRLSDLASKQTILAKTNNSCILFDEAEDVMNRGFTEFGSASKAYLNTLLEETPVPIFWTTNNIYTVDPAFLRRMTYTIEFEKLTDDIRLNIWKKVVRKNKLKVNKEKLVELNKNYDIPPSLISNAVKTTKLINGSQDDFEIFVENVAKVVTKKKNVKKKKEFEMKEYSEKLINTDLDISDLTSKIKSCGKLNFSLCLYGEPGTGKSLYARYLAKELGIDVILKRASDLMSKYVGETEQNIAEAFEEAKSKKAMLIFDEADSFLQNRNNAVRNWEVSQVNEMLTWMESHEYPFVCTTNLLDTLDEASLRRFTFKIKFDFMTSEQTNLAMGHFFGIKNANLNIKGLTAGDFATVKKKADFLCITDLYELSKMLEDEVKIKKSKELQNCVGF
ncbi:ATP-binding protein [bacterium]|nr:ATP-binding protein [bacterium]